MKKVLLLFTIIFTCMISIQIKSEADSKEMVTIQIPADEINNIDVKYQKTESNGLTKFMDATKKATKKTVDSTKQFTGKTVKATKKATKKTVNSTKSISEKTIEATKTATKKTVETTKDVKDKTVDTTKDFIDNINPNRVVSVEEIETKSAIKTLKNEKKELTSAYNSRIKDIDAKIRLTQVSTNLTEAQRQNRTYNLNKEKADIVKARDEAIVNYNLKIKNLRESNK